MFGFGIWTWDVVDTFCLSFSFYVLCLVISLLSEYYFCFPWKGGFADGGFVDMALVVLRTVGRIGLGKGFGNRELGTGVWEWRYGNRGLAYGFGIWVWWYENCTELRSGGNRAARALCQGEVVNRSWSFGQCCN